MTQHELNSALVEASQKGNLNLVQELVKQGAKINYGDDFSLRYAAQNGHLGVVKYLIANGADIHVQDDAALQNAFALGRINVIRYLVQKGVDYHKIEIHSFTHMKMVKYKNEQAPIDYALGEGYDYTKSRKQQIIDAVKKNPSIIKDLPKKDIENIPEIEHLLKSDEYGLFERNIFSYEQWLKNNL